MNQELFKKKLKAAEIFEEQKDKAILSIKHLRKLYSDIKEDIDFRELYTKIINYQIKKYGGQLADPNQIEYYYLKYLESRGEHWRRKI